jgi:hypothetical protein
MNWFASNWIWLALGIGVLALFRFGGGCGMSHGGHDHRQRAGDDEYDRPSDAASGVASRGDASHAAVEPRRHRHGC